MMQAVGVTVIVIASACDDHAAPTTCAPLRDAIVSHLGHTDGCVLCDKQTARRSKLVVTMAPTVSTSDGGATKIAWGTLLDAMVPRQRCTKSHLWPRRGRHHCKLSGRGARLRAALDH